MSKPGADGAIDATHDPALASWVESANGPGTDFPIQNLPFGRFRVASDLDWQFGVAIGTFQALRHGIAAGFGGPGVNAAF